MKSVLPEVARVGLAVLLQQGLAAWVEQWSKLPAPTTVSPGETPKPSLLPDDCSAQLINLLATMALAHIQEVRA